MMQAIFVKGESEILHFLITVVLVEKLKKP